MRRMRGKVKHASISCYGGKGKMTKWDIKVRRTEVILLNDEVISREDLRKLRDDINEVLAEAVHPRTIFDDDGDEWTRDDSCETEVAMYVCNGEYRSRDEIERGYGIASERY